MSVTEINIYLKKKKKLILEKWNKIIDIRIIPLYMQNSYIYDFLYICFKI